MLTLHLGRTAGSEGPENLVDAPCTMALVFSARNPLPEGRGRACGEPGADSPQPEGPLLINVAGIRFAPSVGQVVDRESGRRLGSYWRESVMSV